METEDPKKKKSRLLDKVLMGAVIGGAIGSVVGAAIAPQSGKKTREELVEKAKVAGETSSKIFKLIKRWIFKKGTPVSGQTEDSKKIPHEHNEI